MLGPRRVYYEGMTRGVFHAYSAKQLRYSVPFVRVPFVRAGGIIKSIKLLLWDHVQKKARLFDVYQ